ncbi:alpha-ketoglutarate-dependent dioxygenase AlkB [Kitasatospora acidiphila]|uniref:Alpha-ketoglutarate-dependent dioxygenase AlkB n=1 Tax=Kitasatospora acidiphila TaxID=2567942 RepID=A0A540W1I9_9ACTN|nr:alpha-ketoglutarate-dependent dioxygenase AlkB [Kitasatospora acidiphila]TQF02871.1 alpha-ketoglutarate-dependent dioxygenase AlkB [Kitasatospora acidiphila]
MTGELFPRPSRELAPGAVLLPDWLDLTQQRELVAACREWARPPAGLRRVRLPGGAEMSVRQVCLGWHWAVVPRCPTCGVARKAAEGCPRHWFPYAYLRTTADGDGAPVKPFPAPLGVLARRAVAAAYGPRVAQIPGALDYAPDVALVNHYGEGARMGLHQDLEERTDAPVVSLSLGDSCVFRLGNSSTRNRPWTDVELRSGDLLVFGGPARYAYHGVLRTLPGTADPVLGLSGRLNITVRCTGLAD